MKEVVITIELYEWLKKEWRYNNHPKYQQYFEEWIGGITQEQADAFAKQKERQETSIFAHLRPKKK